MLRARSLSAIALLVPVAVLLWLGDIPWLAGIVIVAGLGVSELVTALRRDSQPLTIVGGFLAIALPCAAYLDASLAALLPVIVLAIMASLVLAMLRPIHDSALASWALSLAAMLYITLLLSFFVALRQRDQGLSWILLAFFCTWACDSAAYLVGGAIGKHAFAPLISPKKTWEGTVGGVVAGTLTGLLATPLLGLPPALGLLLGCAIAIVAVLGDLAESFIKRQLGIKDFGTLIPGHGGVLDRVDSLLFAAPLVYYVALCWGRF